MLESWDDGQKITEKRLITVSLRGDLFSKEVKQ
jgi:hypothetical protein